MSFKKIVLSFCGIQLGLLSATAHAQSSNFDRAYAQRGAEARLSLTIPLGNSFDKAKTAPRLNFGVRNYQQSSELNTDWLRGDRQDYRDISLGLTLEQTPKLMMNEQILWFPEDDQTNIGTAGKIGLGIGAAVLIGVAVVGVIYATTDFAEDA